MCLDRWPEKSALALHWPRKPEENGCVYHSFVPAAHLTYCNGYSLKLPDGTLAEAPWSKPVTADISCALEIQKKSSIFAHRTVLGIVKLCSCHRFLLQGALSRIGCRVPSNSSPGLEGGLVNTENVATRGFLHSTPRMVIPDHGLRAYP